MSTPSPTGDWIADGNTAGAECLAAALDYLSRGWSAIPCCPPDHIGVGKNHGSTCHTPGKRPLVNWTEYQKKRPVARDLENWWRKWSNANVYIVLGPVSGLIRVDVDRGQGEAFLLQLSGGDLPDTLTMTTGSGRGLFYRIPDGFTPRITHNLGDKIHEGLSLLGQGSGTVMPPSRHSSGRRYAWAPGRGPGEIEAAPMTRWLMEAMKPDARGRGATGGPAEPGHRISANRNIQLTRMAGAMRNKGATPKEILAALLVINEDRCDPPLDESEVESIANGMKRYKPDPQALITGALPGAGNSSTTEQNGHASLIITPLSRKKAKPVRYIVPGRIPLGKLILVGGRGGNGKSTWARALAADISAGRCAFGMDYPGPVQAKVLIVAAEDGPEDTILPGLLACSADVERIAILEGVKYEGKKSDFTLLPAHVELVRARLKASPEIKLIIIDPVASFVGRTRVDDHRATELRLVLDPLSALAEEFGVTIILIAHLNKSSGDAVDRIAGSAAYRDTVRAAFLAVEDPEDENRRLMVPVKENLPGFDRTSIPFRLEKLTDPEALVVMLSPQFADLDTGDREILRGQMRRVVFDAPVTVDANEATKPKKDDKNKVQKCAEFLAEFLKDHAYPSNEILDAAKRAGFTFDNVKEAKVRLKESGLQNSNMGRLRGQWWSGFGRPDDWTLRPDPPCALPPPTTPQSPHSPLSPYSPLSPHIGEGRDFETGETGEIGETLGSGVSGVLFRVPSGIPD